MANRFVCEMSITCSGAIWPSREVKNVSQSEIRLCSTNSAQSNAKSQFKIQWNSACAPTLVRIRLELVLSPQQMRDIPNWIVIVYFASTSMVTTTTTPTTTMSTDGKIIETKLSAISRNQRCTTNYSLLWLSLSCNPPRWRSFTFARAHIRSDRSEYSWQSSWWTWLDIRNEHAEPEEPIGWLAILIGEWYWSFTVEILWIKPLNRWEFEYNRNIMCREDHSVAGRTPIAVIGQFVDVVDYLAEYSKCVFFLLNNFFFLRDDHHWNRC